MSAPQINPPIEPTNDPASLQTPPAGPEADAPEPWTHRLREAALIVAVALTLNLAGNGRISLWDRDEPRYAGATREMRESGDYIHPTFNAEPRYHKPILIYWLMLGGTAIGGDNPFGARLVSALAGVGSCLLIWGLGRRMFGRPVGLIAALMLATAPIFAYNSKLATTDATLTFFLIVCLFALWELGHRASRAWAMTFWVAFALVTLTKGPIGPVILLTAATVSWWWGGPTLAWLPRLRWSWGLPIFALLTLPWYIAIGIISKGDFYRVSMGYHVMRRMTTGIETHGGFPGYYVALSMIVFYPWAALLPAGILGAWSRRRQDPAFGFLLGWIVGPLIFLEIVRTKLIHYYLPAYPAAALVCAWLVVALVRAEVNLRRWPLGRLSLGMLTGIGIGMTVALLAGALVAPEGLRAPCLVLAVILGPGTLLGMERFQAGASRRAAYVLAGTWGLFLTVTASWLLPSLEPHRLTQLVAGRMAQELARTPEARPIMAQYKPPGIVYELGRPVPEMTTREDVITRTRQTGPLISALAPPEIALLRKEPRVRLEMRGTVRGIDVEHARPTTLQLVVIHPVGTESPPAAPSAPPIAAGHPAEQTQVQ